MFKFIRRLLNKDERVGESILSKDCELYLVEGDSAGGTVAVTKTDNYHIEYEIHLDGFNIKVVRRVGIDMTCGSSWYEYSIKIDGMSMEISGHTSSSIFNKLNYFYNREDIEDKNFLYKDIKTHFNSCLSCR